MQGFFVLFLNTNIMTNVPDSFNLSQLQAAFEDAPKEAEIKSSKTPQSSKEYEEMIIDMASKHCTNAFEELQDPVLHKAMAMCILHNLMAYHQRKAEALAAEGDLNTAFMWVKDFGQLQVLMDTLRETSISHSDFFAQDISSQDEDAGSKTA